MKQENFLINSFSLLIISLLFVSLAQAAPRCDAIFLESQKHIQRTALEADLFKGPPPLPPSDRLNQEINKLKATNPQLAKEVAEVRNLKEKGRSVSVDRSRLTTAMNIFIESAYSKVVGARGLSRPFVSFENRDDKVLIIRHVGDQHPLMVRWTQGVANIGQVRSEKIDGTLFQILDIPEGFIDRKMLSQVEDKHIHALISGSSLNKYIASSSSPITTMAAALHDGKLVFDRPTQVEAKEVRKLIRGSDSLRDKMKSLLFVAPTASGKTRVLGDAIVDLIGRDLSKKLIIIATKTPDLTSELGRSIGMQLHQEVSLAKFRLVQWGGQLTDAMSHADLIRFVDASDVPVVLVTSYPTVAARSSSSEMKSELLNRARGFLIDEAHNATGDTFTELMKAARRVADIDIMGVTASPITRSQRTTEIFDGVFWAGVDKPGQWLRDREKNSGKIKDSNRAIEWLRMAEQYKNAMVRGEINASEPLYYHPEERGFKFTSIFKRAESGTASRVNLERLQDIWPDVSKMIEGHGPGVIHTYPRDADPIAERLSQVTGKNYVSLQKMSQEERILVYEAFRSGSLYKGQPVDAIVGTIREGLDFPKAGWYLNFKKYVRFPENIQGPGRVVRLALNKLNPVIIFFGEEVDKTSYAQVKDLVMNRLGKLPRQLPEGRLYSGIRRQRQRESMAKAIENLNANMEAFLRIQSNLTKLLGPDKDHLNPEVIKDLQNILLDMRYSSKNREIDLALNQFVAECYSYPFFKGDLKSSWTAAERIISLSKLTAEQRSTKKISNLEAEYLARPDVIEMAKEFRGFFGNIGPVPRAVLETLSLKILNVAEVAEAINAFVRHHGKVPSQEGFGPNELSTMLEHTLSVSPERLWRQLSPESKQLLQSRFDIKSRQDLEATLNEFFVHTKEIPKFDFELAVSHNRDVYTNLSSRLASEMNKKILSGELDVSTLNVEFRNSLEQSEVLAAMVIKLQSQITKVKNESVSAQEYVQRLKDEGYFTYNQLMLTKEFGLLMTIQKLAELNPHGPAAEYKRQLESVM